MHNLAPTRALARRSRQLLVIAVVIGAIGAFIIALGVLMTMIPLVAEGSSNYALYNLARMGLIAFGGLLLLLAVGLAIRAITWRIDNDLAQEVGHVLAQALDGRFTFIRNISRRDIGYVDAVLVGPPGALVFRIMNEKGVFANEGPNWLKRRRGGGWAPWSPGPTRQVVADIKKLRDYLAHHGLGDVPVYGVIVFLHEPPLVELQGKNPVVPPTHLGTLIANLQSDYFARDRIDEGHVVRIGRALFQS